MAEGKKKIRGVRMADQQFLRSNRNAKRVGITFSEYLRRCELIAGSMVVSTSHGEQLAFDFMEDKEPVGRIRKQLNG